MTTQFKNFATSKLAASLSSTSTTLYVSAGTGILFPSPSSGDSFKCVIFDKNGNKEIIKVTARSVDTFGTIIRAQEGTTARSWNAADRIEMRVTAEILEGLRDQETSGIARDGSRPPTADTPWNNKKITGVAELDAAALKIDGVDIEGVGGSGKVGHAYAESPAVLWTQSAINNNDRVSILRFLNPTTLAAIKAGSYDADVKIQLATAFAASANIDLVNGTYDLGDIPNSTTPVFTIDQKYRGEVCGNGAHIKANSTTQGAGFTPLFSITNSQALKYSGFYFEDSGLDRTINFKGMSLFNFPQNNGVCDDISFDRIYAKKTGRLVGADNGTDAVTNVHLNAKVVQSYYGVNFQGNVHGLTGRIITDDVLRSYFVYGCENHRLLVLSNNHPSSSADVLIKSYEIPTRDIYIDYVAKGQNSNSYAVSLELQSDSNNSSLEDIEVRIKDTDGASNPLRKSIVVRAYNLAGTLQANTSMTMKRFKFSGAADHEIDFLSKPAVDCEVTVNGRRLLDLLKTPMANLAAIQGFIFTEENGRLTKVTGGNLSTNPITLDMSSYDSSCFHYKMTAYCVADTTNFSGASTYTEDIITGYNAGGGAVNISTANVAKKFQTTDAGVTYTGSGENIIISFPNYSIATGFAVVSLTRL